MTGPLIALALGAALLGFATWLTHTDNRRHPHDQDPRP